MPSPWRRSAALDFAGNRPQLTAFTSDVLVSRRYFTEFLTLVLMAEDEQTMITLFPGYKEEIKSLDVHRPKRIKRTDPGHPACNVFRYGMFRGDGNMVGNWAVLMQGKLADILIDYISPIQEKRRYYESHKDLVMDILNKGRQAAEEFASKTINEVREAMGNESI
jgi:hypothetical protein